MLTLKIECLMPGGSWIEILGHACETDEQAMAYVYRFGMPRPPTMGEVEALRLGMKETIFASAANRWREEWAKGPTMRVTPKIKNEEFHVSKETP